MYDSSVVKREIAEKRLTEPDSEVKRPNGGEFNFRSVSFPRAVIGRQNGN